MPSYEALVWAQLAEEAGAVADRIDYPDLKRTMLAIALRCEAMARWAAETTRVNSAKVACGE